MESLLLGGGRPLREGLFEIAFYFPGATEETVDEEDAGEFAHG